MAFCQQPELLLSVLCSICLPEGQMCYSHRLASWNPGGTRSPAFRVLGRRSGMPSALTARGTSGSDDPSCDRPGGNEGPAGFQIGESVRNTPRLGVANIQDSGGSRKPWGPISSRATEEARTKYWGICKAATHIISL
jgi:hypothetical protein